MADPACGTGATQLETQGSGPVQLVWERRGDEDGSHNEEKRRERIKMGGKNVVRR